MRPIDADELKRRLLEERDKIPLTIVERYSLGVETPNRHGQSMRGGIHKALRCMEETPTLKTKPVVRGRWESWRFYFQVSYQKQCCICGSWSYDIGKFCPNCGVDMSED